jgi:crossover junction endodeoxyribonuclease RuvC
MYYRIGIDPGISGAIALLAYESEKSESLPRLVLVLDMPVMTLNGKKQQVNAAGMTKMITQISTGIKRTPELIGEFFKVSIEESNTPNNIAVYLEQVSAMPGQGVTGMFNFGMSYGMVQGVVAGLGLSLVLVRPSAWKKRAGLINTEKDQARTLAQQFFPAADLNRKKDIGRADAILIAMFGRE